MNKFVVLYGPTAVGKTDLSLELARKINAEIVNMDVGQFYVPLSIGTAKPDWKNSDIVHHLFDILKEAKHFTVVEYFSQVEQLLHAIWDKGKVPLLVGGSGFYLHNLLFPLVGTKQNQDRNFCSDAIINNDDTAENKWDLLYMIDPERAKVIHPNDTYRIARALSLYKTMKKVASVLAPQFDPIAPCHIICLSREVNELHERISKRIEIMFEEGFVAEVRQLLDTPWETFMLQKKLIGYNELITYLRHQKIDQNSVPQVLKNTIALRTRQYAKRQRTFWRYLEKKIYAHSYQKECFVHTVDLSKIKKDLLIKSILDKIKHYL